MAWFGESLSSLTGHLQNLTKEVLSESSDEAKDAAGALKATREKLEELEAVCTAQDLEISALKKQNAELRRRLEQVGGLERSQRGGSGDRSCSGRRHSAAPAFVAAVVAPDAPSVVIAMDEVAAWNWHLPPDEDPVVVPTAPTTWLTIEQRCDAGYAGGRGKTNGSNKGHIRALSDATAVSAKHQERLEKELNERIHVIDHLQIQLKNVEKERYELSQRISELEEQLQQSSLGDKFKERKLSVQIEDKLIQENNELKCLLNDANKRTKELEEELFGMRNQCLDHVIDSQVNASELRLDVEQTRKRLANELGAQRAEKLRAHQDMVNRMIQMGEKTRETEQNVKKLQTEDRRLTAEMVSKIQKLGDQEQQELIQGTLKALELENQVLNMRNAQLEREAMREAGIKMDERKSCHDGMDFKSKSDGVKSEDDTDDISIQSAVSDITMKLENQIAQLQNQVEIYKRDVKHYEMVRDDLSHEKLELQEEVKQLKDQLQKRQQFNNAASQNISFPTKTLEQNKSDETSSEKESELEMEFVKLKEVVKILQEEKVCMGQELQAMAKIIQDLESKVSSGEAERRELETSMEELDQQHQDALDKLIVLRKIDIAENEHLKSLVQELELTAGKRIEMKESLVQTEDLLSKYEESSTQTDVIHQYDQENQTTFINHDKQTLTDIPSCNYLKDSDTSKYGHEMCEKIRKLVNVDLPHVGNNKITEPVSLVEDIMKVLKDCKWKKDTLERKVSELIRENAECKSTITILEEECCNLKDNVERLAEQLVGVAKSGSDQLPTILENSEEIEMLEQKNAMLEEEISVLRETRVNLEKDAVRMREEQEELAAKIRNLEAHQKNQENIQAELQRRAEEAESSANAYKIAIEIAENSQKASEDEAKSIRHEFEVNIQSYMMQLDAMSDMVRELNKKNLDLSEEVKCKENEIHKLHGNVSILETEKISLKSQLQEKESRTEEIEMLIFENKALKSKISDLQNKIAGTDNIEVKLLDVREKLKESMKTKSDLEIQLECTKKTLNEMVTVVEGLKADAKKLPDVAITEEVKAHDSAGMVSKLQEDNEMLQEKLTGIEDSFQSVIHERELHIKEIEDLKRKIDINQEAFNDSFECLNAEIKKVNDDKKQFEEKLSYALLVENSLRKELELLKTQLLEHEHEQKEKAEDLRAQVNSLLEEKASLVEENSQHKSALQDLQSIKMCSQENSNNLSNKKILLLENEPGNSLELNKLAEEKQLMSDMLEEKMQEVELLQSKLKELIIVVNGSTETIRNLEHQNEVLTNEKLECMERIEMSKESVSKLSELIKEKDKNLCELRDQLSQLTNSTQRSDELDGALMQAQETITQVNKERDQLLQTVHVKHQESVQYHAEIQRLSNVLSQEISKNQQLTAQNQALVQQFSEQPSSSAKHEQEVKHLQDLMRMKDEGLQQLCNRLELKEQELQSRGMELEALQNQLEIMGHERSQQAMKAPSAYVDHEEKYKELLIKFQDEQRRAKNFQNELEACQGRELVLQKELERLRIHLVETEDTYTQEALKTEEYVKDLSSKLQQAEEMLMSSNTVYKSANIRANQQVETLQEQARLIAQQRDDVQMKLSVAEDQVAKHSAALRNLQAVLEQFQRDREREIEAARASVFVKVEAAQRKHEELLGEITLLKTQLKEAKEGLGAASRLGEELEKKTDVINKLKLEVTQLEEKAVRAQDAAKKVCQTAEGKVDKSLVKNVILGFFLAPTNSKGQVLHVVASVLDFSKDEKERIQKKLGLHVSDGSGGWFNSLLHPGGQSSSNNESLSEAFVRFLENESIPQPKLKMLPDTEKSHSSNSNSPQATTPSNIQRKSPLLLADVQLPTFAQFPVGRNSSSILKDILKES